MNRVVPPLIRTFAIVGHATSGKTSLADRMLFKAGAVKRLGRVEDHTSVSDYRPEEHERRHSLYATLLHCSWQGQFFLFIDTPGYADYVGEMIASLRAADTALVVINANEGIQAGANRAWKTAKELGLPRAFFINGLDREQSDFTATVAALQASYGATTCVPITIPVGKEDALQRVVSVLQTADIPADLRAVTEKYRSGVLDAIAEADEAFMMRYLDGAELSDDEIALGMKNAVLKGTLTPIYCGSAAKDVGVAELMDGIVHLFNAPLERNSLPVEGETLALRAEGDGHGFVFKNVVDQGSGHFAYVRVYSGVFQGDDDVYNVSNHAKERFGHVVLVNGKDTEPVTEIGPGYIVAVPKLKHTKINDTLCTAAGGKPFPPMRFPPPSISYACYPVRGGEEDKIASGLHRLMEEDPTAHIERQPETHELLLSGMGDQHVAMLVHRLATHAKVNVDLRPPKVPYRETVTGVGDAKYRHKKQSGGHGQFAEVWLRVEPLPGAEFEFASEVVGGTIPKNFIPSVEKGVLDALKDGPLAHCRVVNVKAIVYDGKHHAVDSSDIAFQIAGRSAFREAIKTARPILLEPLMKLAIVIPAQYMGDVSGDLNHRRGRILGMALEEGMDVVHAEAPLAEMHTYASNLRSITHGRGSFTMEFSRYEQVPAAIAKHIQEAAAKETVDES